MTGKPFLAVDASILDNKEYHDAIRQDVEYNRISFEFPNGLSVIPLIEECRALNALDDFDLMYDITMQLLAEKPVHILLKDYEGNKKLVESFMVTDRYQDLRGVAMINQYPVIVNWLVKFVSEMLRKKYPRPSVDELRQAAQEGTEKPLRKKKKQDSKA